MCHFFRFLKNMNKGTVKIKDLRLKLIKLQKSSHEQ